MQGFHSLFQKVRLVVLTLLLAVSFSYNAFGVDPLMSIAQRFYYGHGTPQNFQKAFSLYLKAAEQGDVDAMFIVGGMYMKGQGTGVNTAEAFRWLYNAAINGRSSKESERILAEFFVTGKNVPQNYEEALHWYELAANGGDFEAQSELGYLYFTGKVGEKDYKKAAHWFELAARNDYPLAQYNMGILWYTGNGVDTVDMIKAYAWFSLAAANGYGSGVVAENFLKTVLSDKELKDAQEASMEIYREIKSLNQGAVTN